MPSTPAFTVAVSPVMSLTVAWKKFISPMKSATSRQTRAFIERARRGHLQHLAALHHRHAVGQRQRLFLVVGHQHEGDADLPLQGAQLDLHRLAQPLVERPQGLVQQQHLGLAHQRTGQRHALALAAGQLVGAAPAETLQLDHRQHGLDPGAQRILGAAVSLRKP